MKSKFDFKYHEHLHFPYKITISYVWPTTWQQYWPSFRLIAYIWMHVLVASCSSDRRPAVSCTIPDQLNYGDLPVLAAVIPFVVVSDWHDGVTDAVK
jgi:hypothetical protein